MKVIDKILRLSEELAKEARHFQKNRISAGELREFLQEFRDVLEMVITVINGKEGVSLCK